MKVIDIAIKDILQASRSLTIFFFMFVVPIGVTLLFMLIFQGIGDDEGFQLPTVDVIIVNLDQGQLPEQFDVSAMGNLSGGASSANLENASSMGEVLQGILGLDIFSDLMQVSQMNSRNAARLSVDNQQADVAIIIPDSFSDSLNNPEITSRIELYRDPTLTIGPAIVEAILQQILDSFNAAQIGIYVTMDQLALGGVQLDGALRQEIASRFTAAFSEGRGSEGDANDVLVSVSAPSGLGEATDIISQITGTIFSGMMVFFAFYTGAASMETMLTEEERGTLARLFTTPTSHRIILGGKAMATIITLSVQISVLLVFGSLVLKIDWGAPGSLILSASGIIIIAAATGAFLVSILKNTKQGGIVFGGILTVTGMLGLVPIFTSGAPNQPESLETITLFVPQGWAMRGFTSTMDGASMSEVLPIFGVVLIWSVVLAFIGQYRLQKRFA